MDLTIPKGDSLWLDFNTAYNPYCVYNELYSCPIVPRQNYIPIEGTNPPKHSTGFDQFTDQVLPAIQEPILSDNPDIAYAGAVDVNGYFPTHNKKFSQPLTGNYETDFVNNRTKRIFDDRTGSRCGSNQSLFLLQTYKRDTGEIMHDLSVPIWVNGEHWGGFRVGYASQLSIQ